MDINKIKVVSFAIRYRLMGYRLLQNPKGTSPYQIKMIKSWSGISDKLDRFDHFHTKSKNFSNPKEKTVKKTLLVTRYMFWKDKNYKKVVKEMLYQEHNAHGDFITKSKAPLSYEEIMKRNTAYIDKEHTKGPHRELVPFLFIPVERNVPTVESIADREISKFFQQKRKNNIPQDIKSFLKTLRKNLVGQ